MLYEIKNEYLTVNIKLFGSELSLIKDIKNTDNIIEFKDNIAIACISPDENFIRPYGVTII